MLLSNKEKNQIEQFIKENSPSKNLPRFPLNIINKLNLYLYKLRFPSIQNILSDDSEKHMLENTDSFVLNPNDNFFPIHFNGITEYAIYTSQNNIYLITIQNKSLFSYFTV